MTSKESLDEIIRSFNDTTTGMNGLGEVVVDNCLIRCNKPELEIIQKDLERLEKLEKENKSLKLTIKCQNASEEQMKSYALGLEQENKKLKKSIEIMTLKAITPYIFLKKIKRNVIDLKFEEKICFDFGINKKEFELLKEVLCDV